MSSWSDKGGRIEISTEQTDRGQECWVKNETYWSIQVTYTINKTLNMGDGDKLFYEGEKRSFVIKGPQPPTCYLRIVPMGAGPCAFGYQSSITYATPTTTLPSPYPCYLPFDASTPRVCGQGNHGKVSHFDCAAYAFDFDMPIGTPLLAATEGVVVETKDDSDTGGPDKSFMPFGNYVTVQHADLSVAQYMHLRKGGAVAKEGQQIRIGDLIGYSGNTGWSSGPHLHFVVNAPQEKSIPSAFIARSTGRLFIPQEKELIGADGPVGGQPTEPHVQPTHPCAAAQAASYAHYVSPPQHTEAPPAHWPAYGTNPADAHPAPSLYPPPSQQTESPPAPAHWPQYADTPDAHPTLPHATAQAYAIPSAPVPRPPTQDARPASPALPPMRPAYPPQTPQADAPMPACSSPSSAPSPSPLPTDDSTPPPLPAHRPQYGPAASPAPQSSDLAASSAAPPLPAQRPPYSPQSRSSVGAASAPVAPTSAPSSSNGIVSVAGPPPSGPRPSFYAHASRHSVDASREAKPSLPPVNTVSRPNYTPSPRSSVDSGSVSATPAADAAPPIPQSRPNYAPISSAPTSPAAPHHSSHHRSYSMSATPAPNSEPIGPALSSLPPRPAYSRASQQPQAASPLAQSTSSGAVATTDTPPALPPRKSSIATPPMLTPQPQVEYAPPVPARPGKPSSDTAITIPDQPQVPPVPARRNTVTAPAQPEPAAPPVPHRPHSRQSSLSYSPSAPVPNPFATLPVASPPPYAQPHGYDSYTVPAPYYPAEQSPPLPPRKNTAPAQYPPQYYQHQP